MSLHPERCHGPHLHGQIRVQIIHLYQPLVPGLYARPSACDLGQVYIFANIQLGKTMAMFGAVSIVLSNIIGLFYLGERISPVSYFGICLAILAFIVMGFK